MENKARLEDYLTSFSMIVAAVLIAGAMVYSAAKQVGARNYSQTKNNGAAIENSTLSQPPQNPGNGLNCGV